MNAIKKFLESMRQYVSPKTRALEHELDAVRKAHDAASAEMTKVRESLQLNHEDDAQLLADLQQRLKQTESEYGRAREQLESLESSIADAGQRQKSTEDHVALLEAKLVGERSSARERIEKLERAIADAGQRMQSTGEHVAALEEKLEGERSTARERIESQERAIADAGQRQKSTEERAASLEAKLEAVNSSARERVELLERAIADAGQRQKSTEERAASLEAKLEEERSSARERIEYLERAIADAGQRMQSTGEHVAALEEKLQGERGRHEAGTQATQTLLARMQDEQQSHMKRLPELQNNIQGVTARLQDSLQLESRQRQQSQQKLMIIFGVLFAAGVLAGAYIMQVLQDRKHELALVEQDVREMGESMKQRLDNQDRVLNELVLAVNRQTSSELALAGNESPAPEAGTPEADKVPQTSTTFTPDIHELQASLMVLGFDLGIAEPNGEPGIKTRQALQEFRQFYLPDSDAKDDVITEQLAALILKSADVARVDAARLRISSDVLAAIRLGSIRTGVDFSFLMEMARVESYFNPAARAPKSSATGLFQFKDSAWLESIRTFGAGYGLKDYAERVKLVDDGEGGQQPIVRDPLQLEVLALRLNPRLSALMAAENIRRNLETLSADTRHAPVRTNLYLAHFMGLDDAATFLATLEEAPETIAGDIFPEQAELYPGVFQNRQGRPRTVAEVYRRFDGNFNIGRYDERNPG